MTASAPDSLQRHGIAGSIPRNRKLAREVIDIKESAVLVEERLIRFQLLSGR